MPQRELEAFVLANEKLFERTTLLQTMQALKPEAYGVFVVMKPFFRSDTLKILTIKIH